jgi:hypothetical protein
MARRSPNTLELELVVELELDFSLCRVDVLTRQLTEKIDGDHDDDDDQYGRNQPQKIIARRSCNPLELELVVELELDFSPSIVGRMYSLAPASVVTFNFRTRTRSSSIARQNLRRRQESHPRRRRDRRRFFRLPTFFWTIRIRSEEISHKESWRANRLKLPAHAR